MNAQKSHESDKFSISFPDEWTLDDSGMMGTKFLIFSPLEGGQDNFRENVNLVVEDLSGLNIDLETYMEASIQQVTSMISDAEVLAKVKEEDHYKLVFTGTQGIYALKFEQRIFMKEDKAYVVTFTAKQGEFDKFVETARGITQSFVLK